MTQGYPLAMVSYGIGVLPLIKRLKVEYPDVTQPWYDEDAGAIGMYKNTELYYISLTQFSTGHGYYSEQPKSVLIVHPYNLETGILFGLHHGFEFCTGANYLGGFIGDEKSKQYSGFKIIRVHDQNNFWLFRVIPTTRAKLC